MKKVKQKRFKIKIENLPGMMADRMTKEEKEKWVKLFNRGYHNKAYDYWISIAFGEFDRKHGGKDNGRTR